MPAACPFRSAVPVKMSAALWAAGLPFPFGHVRLPAAHRSCPDLQTLLLPDAIMALSRAYQRVGHLMLDSIDDLFRPFPQHEKDGKLDAAAIINAQSQRSLAAVET